MIIAFECPEAVCKHPDVELVMVRVAPNWETVKTAHIVGCKVCQNTRSNCLCGDKQQLSRLLVYDRKEGKLGSVYQKFFM
jgi:hypothetical protein